MTARKPTKSLAQALFEAAPTVGWQGTWERLGEQQQQWWEAYADVARSYLATQERYQIDRSDCNLDEAGACSD